MQRNLSLSTIMYIPTTRGMFATIDSVSFPLLAKYRWYVHCRFGRFYARATTGNGIFMHRLILGFPNGLQIDHVNCNGLDNRKENLRLATPRQNQLNGPPLKGHKYKGITYHKRDRLWEARINISERVQISCGFHRSEEEAARAYNLAASKHYGEFARLNIIQ